MKKVSKLKKTLYLFWYKFWGSRHLSKVGQKHMSFVFLKFYIQASSLFPNATLSENYKLADLVCYSLLDVPPDTEIEEVKKESIERLLENWDSNESAIDAISNYFLLGSLYYDFGNEDGHNKTNKELADEAFAKAKLFKASVERISIQDVKKLNEKIKKEVKVLKKEIAKINSKKIEDEKSKIIKPITVHISIAFLFASLVSSLFLVGGFLYAKFVLGFFEINTSDFFDISDYISSSVDVIFPVFLLTVFVMLCYFGGALKTFSDVIITKQFNVKTKSRGFWLEAAAIISVILFFVTLIYIEIFLPLFLVSAISVISYYIMLSFITIDKYIVNKFTFQSVIFLVFIFIIFLGVYISETLYEVKTGSYQSPYIVCFQEEYKEYSNHAFFLANSNYVFLLNKETKEVVVIPKTGIKALRAKKDDVGFFFSSQRCLSEATKIPANVK